MLIRQVQGNNLFNRQLSSVCQVNGLKSTGVKADLQARIVDRESRPRPLSPSQPFLSLARLSLRTCPLHTSLRPALAPCAPLHHF